MRPKTMTSRKVVLRLFSRNFFLKRPSESRLLNELYYVANGFVVVSLQPFEKNARELNCQPNIRAVEERPANENS
jgi:hypothetical protein